MATFIPDKAGFKALALKPEIGVACVAEADRGKLIAQSLSESFRTNEDHPHYADAFQVSAAVVQVTTSFGSHAAAGATLANTSDHALAVEWGNARDNNPHHVLARTRDIVSGE